MEKVKMQPGFCQGKLTALWSWESKSSGRIWKCRCECGKVCYVKEMALEEALVSDCGCGSNT